MKTIYNYHPDTLELVSEGVADQDPLDNANWLIPAYATDIKPLASKADKAACFIDGVWLYKTDHRGLWYKPTGEQVGIEYLDEIADATWTRTAPPPIPPTAEELMLQAVNAVKEKLQSTIDTKAKTLGFSNGNALMLYAGFTNAFQSLAQTFAQWEASVWVEADAYKAQVIAGDKPMLTPDEAVAMMPLYTA